MNTRFLFILNISLLLILFGFVRTSDFPKQVKLQAVTRFNGLEEFYERIKIRASTRVSYIDTYIKKKICGYIFVNPYFDMNDESSVVMDYKPNIVELMERYPNIFRRIYDRSTRTVTRCFCVTTVDKETYIYTNTNTIRTVSVEGENYQELVFTCLARDTRSNTIKEYFVSADDYNVNAVIGSTSTSFNDYIAARFVFALNHLNKLVIVALAEETAKALAKYAKEVERFYVRNTMGLKRADKPEDDPVCSLTDEEKLRLCAIVVNSAELEVLYEFTPKHEFVQRKCVKREVSFITEIRMWDVSGKIYEEWMIGCTVRSVHAPDQMHFVYISRGYRDNCAYIYTRSWNELTYLRHFYDNVSVLRA